ncbi:MAG: adenosylmethionine--8-amino-7-oxononanoate transaminase [Desulfotalea sp.]
MDIANLLDFDRKHLWHPYTSMTTPLPVYPVLSASGVVIKLKSGEELIDGMSSWWAAIHGYNNPALNKAIVDQTNDVSHIMFGGLTHQPAVELGQTLISLLPNSLDKIFFCDSGSVAIEVAMKMAMQYMYALGKNKKRKFATIRGGYHGDTFHGMSVCDPVNGMHSIYEGVLPKYIFADKPKCNFHELWHDGDFSSMRSLVERHQHELAGIIVEPVVQGAGGMHFYHSEYLKNLRLLCDEFDLILIADEIATGFGRTGKLFACEHADIIPDIICIGKALTGGYMTLAASITSTKIAETISSHSPGVFMHGPTFMANPLACSVANASLKLLLENNWQQQVQILENGLTDGLSPCNDCSHVEEVRVLGGIGVIELKNALKLENMVKIQQKFVDHGVWVRPFGKLVYLMPPYIISSSELKKLCNSVCKVVIEGDW